jgi:nicotinamide-nucleotide amidase
MERFDIIAQGEEIVSGALVDSNSARICTRLGEVGLVPGRITAVGDVLDDLVSAFREAAARSRVVVSTGGLGPTSDDLTAEAVARAFDRPLREDPVALAQIEARYASRGRTMPPLNRKQAMLPDGARVLENTLGTAPGFLVEVAGSVIHCLPGPPFEMRPMLDRWVVPDVAARFSLPPRRTIVLRCFGMPESVAAERMAGFARDGVEIGYRAAMPEVHVKLHVSPGVDTEPLLDEARARLGDVVFGVDTGDLASVCHHHLQRRGETVAVAESCTGGRLGAMLTAMPGASRTFVGGALVYANREKIRQCGVPSALLDVHGAVSEPVARALAEGMRAACETTWGLSVTGIAGPDGGTPEKPVGTVWVACAGPNGTSTRLVRAPYDRERVMAFAAGNALDLLRRATVG